MKAVRIRGLMITLIGLVVTGAVALIAPGYFEEGAQVPVHWGINGPDRFADASTASLYLWIVPGACVFAGMLFAGMPSLEPFRENLDRSIKAYNAVWVGVTALLIFVQIGIAASMTGHFVPGEEFPRAILAAVGLFFIVIGNYMPKTRANFIFGIRTPWTLTSDTAWEKTHRLGGRLFILAGLLAIALSGIAPIEMMVWLFIGILLPLISILFVYSFFAWKSATDRMGSSDYIV
ncbi:MAG: SdpI family protein [Pseudomonadota bacterium]